MLAKRFLRHNCAAWEPLGMALWQHHTAGKARFCVHSNVEKDIYVPAPAYYKRGDQFYAMEQEMMQRAEGRIADIGAGSGSHALKMQAENKLVDAYEIDALLVKIMTERGVKNTINVDVRTYIPAEKYDTLFMSMNGIGLAGNIRGLFQLLAHLKDWIAPGGRLLFDTTDLSYITRRDKERSSLPDTVDNEYFGVVTYQLSYGRFIGAAYQWLFLDHDTAIECFKTAGFSLHCFLQQEDSRAYEAKLI